MGLFSKILMFSPVKLLGHRFVSTWVVLAIDLLLISFSLVLSFLLLTNIQLYEVSFIAYYKGLFSVLFFSLIGHFVFKPHLGLIRHTTLHDIKRVFFARILSFGLSILFILYQFCN
jgi:hypothetical protein